MQSNAAMVSLVTQGQVPAKLATLPTSSVFSHKYSSSVRSASLDSYYALNTQPAVSADATCTFDVQYGDYISGISLVCTLPAIVNVTTVRVDEDGNPSGGSTPYNFRAIVPQEADVRTNTTVGAYVVRTDDSSDIGVVSVGTSADNLATDLNAANDHAAHFCDYVGARLLKSVDLLVNGKKTQCFTGSWLFVFNELYRTSAGKSAAGLGAADPTVTSALSRLSDKNRAKKVEALRGSELEIELPFFFSQASESQGGSGGGGSPFPRFQFSRHDALQVRFHFHSLKSLVVNSAGLGGEVLSIVADRAQTQIPVQTVTVADKPGESSSVASYLLALSSAPKRDDFRASDFVLGVRVRETYVDPVTLSSQRVAPYRAAVAQPHTCEAAAVKAGTDVTLDAMKYVNLPVHSIYVVPRMLENTVMNRWFSTEGPVDALTGCSQPCISKLAIHLGSTVYNHDTSSSVTIHAKQNAAKFATSVATHHAIFQHNFSQTNPFALHSASSSSSSSSSSPSSSSVAQVNAPSCVPNGCVMLSAVKGSRVVVTPNLAAFRNHSAAGGSNYSVGRGSATGNEIAFVCHTLHFNTISIVPDRTNRTEPVVQLGVEDTNRLPETITAN